MHVVKRYNIVYFGNIFNYIHLSLYELQMYNSNPRLSDLLTNRIGKPPEENNLLNWLNKSKF